MILYVIIAIIVLILLYFLVTYNNLVSLRNKKDDSWSQIEVQLKRRADLIPNLVETVKGYAKHEKGTLTEVIEARNKYNAATTPEEEIEASNQITGALTKLFALAENYPDLKANTNFIQLQRELTETEDRISLSRQIYNDTVLTYNNKVQMVPSNIVAGMFGFKKGIFFEASEADKKTPEVKF